MRFTVDGSEAFEKRIASDMEAIRASVLESIDGADLTALVLGGGYGRGEGGVFEVDGEERVYNDYDFFVVVPFTSRRKRRALSAKLDEIKASMEPAFGVHVDFSPPMPLAQLPRLPYEVMYMEAREGHHVVMGAADVFSALPAYDPARPPLAEGARLLMNRGVGLLMARMTLDQGTPLDTEDHEFVVRNINKAMMALGDSVLYLHGDYSPSYVERRNRFAAQDLSGVPGAAQLRDLYDASLDFKLRPRHEVPAGETLDEWCREFTAYYLQVFLWFERRRLNKPHLDWAAYRELPTRFPGAGLAERVKNVVRNGRNARPVAGEWILHPRDRILRRLPHLLDAHAHDAAEASQVLHLWKNNG